ncbi:hypothetical protein D3C85_1935180 [compost metagenome]
MLGSLFMRASHGDIINHYRELSLKVDTVCLGRQPYIFARTKEVIRGALIHQRR